MLSKIMMGVSVALFVGLIIASRALMAAKEENGALIQGVETARGVNERQALAMAEVQRNRDELLVQFEREREKARQATEALEANRKGLIQAKADFDQRMKEALEELSDEDLECASLFVPQPLVDGLHDSPSGHNGP